MFTKRSVPLSLVFTAAAFLALGGSTVVTGIARGDTARAPAMLEFPIEPSNATAGTPIPNVKVFVQDSSGKLVTTATNLVTIAIGNNPGGGTLSGTTTVAAVKGQATFTDLSIDKAGVGYTLVASSPGLSGATSAPFTIFAGPTSTLVVSGFPSPTFTGVAGNGTVTATDSFGNTSPAYRGTVAFTSNDPAASLPPHHTFTAQDQGAFVFTATLRTLGTQSITATDLAHPAITGTQSGIVVKPGARFAYAIDTGSNAISQYTVNVTNGQLRPNGSRAGLFVGGGSGGSPHPISLTISPTSTVLYLANDGGGLVMMSIDPASGATTQNAFALISPSGDAITSIAVDPSAQFLYTANHGVTNTIGEFTLDASGDFHELHNLAGHAPYSITVDPAGKFAYVTDSSPSDDVSVYAIGADGTLTEISGSPFSTGSGTDPRSLAIDPSGRFAYVANRGASTLGAYTIDGTSGALTAISGSPFATGTSPSSVVVDPTGRFAFVTNSASNNVSAYTIDGTTGALTPVTGSPFATASGPVSSTVDPTGRFLSVSSQGSNTISVYAIASTGGLTLTSTLTGGGAVAAVGFTVGAPAVYTPAFAYAANSGSNDVSGYAIDASTGALSAVPNSPFAAGTDPVSVFVDLRGRLAYATNNGSNDVSGYLIDGTSGALTADQGSPFSAGTGPFSGTVDPSLQFAYVANSGSNDLTSYDKLDPGTGTIVVNGSPTAAGTDPVSLAVSSNGLFVYVASAASNQVLAYSIALDGTLSSASPFATGTQPAAVAVDPSTRFVYVANSGSGDVSAYTVDPNTGGLTAVQGSPFAAGSSPQSIAVDPSGRFVYVANAGAGNVSAYVIDGTSGALTAVAGSPFAAGTTPASVTVEPSGRFVYVANAGSSNVSAFAIGSSGALTTVAGSPFAAGTTPSSVTATVKIQ
jgi:6-phosphogluconolactonase (cycloisomerase 2 family)